MTSSKIIQQQAGILSMIQSKDYSLEVTKLENPTLWELWETFIKARHNRLSPLSYSVELVDEFVTWAHQTPMERALEEQARG